MKFTPLRLGGVNIDHVATVRTSAAGCPDHAARRTHRRGRRRHGHHGQSARMAFAGTSSKAASLGGLSMLCTFPIL